METITFYSYKGGVGRTLALANAATYLSRFGLSVCLLDFDLEAPGLHYKFPQFLETSDVKTGLVDYISEFSHSGVLPETLDEFSLHVIPASETQGGIRLIPAGNILSPNYWKRLASINWHKLFYEEGSEGIPFFLELKEKISEDFNPDILLIDSRTGITEMSGLCTALLPDKVVFLIVNNRENIEGARQILRSLQTVERLPGQKQIEVIFVLTRIPSFQKDPRQMIRDSGVDEHDSSESQIIEQIQDFLNEPTEGIESQLDVQDICVLHSDRELELSESLRLSLEQAGRETPLLNDYIKLFSRVVPDRIILPKLDNILDEVTSTANLLKDPDKTQQELERIVATYRHPKSLERLIDFYILRNVGQKKILDMFHNLWRLSKSFGTDTSRMMSKYMSLFMEWDPSNPWRGPRFELEIIEEFLESKPENITEVETKLAEAYEEYNDLWMALRHYLQLIDEVREREGILGRILDICIKGEFYDDVVELMKHHSDIIDDNMALRVKKVEILSKMGKVQEVQKLFDAEGAMERYLLEKNPSVYFDVMGMVGRRDEADVALHTLFDKALNNEDQLGSLADIGKVFYRLGRARADEFNARLIKSDLPDSMIKELLLHLEEGRARSARRHKY